MWLYLIKQKEFASYLGIFSSEPVYGESVDLPIINELTGQEVPEGRRGNFKWKNLSLEEIFAVLYQIRNNLFHGQKDALNVKKERDQKLAKAASNFMVPFLRGLMESTSTSHFHPGDTIFMIREN
jgi:hypothetical protein